MTLYRAYLEHQAWHDSRAVLYTWRAMIESTRLEWKAK